ncbi:MULTISPECIES: hypothetical protein [unclassified Guyparkeria]|uniref:hypothetical protein n=1 Tax=unclassified Guyparkeria TaxID=2626246 RepID=UPI0007336878|nr:MULTISPECIES: hypothetical protein [unclassified Guyparkeria]KTG17618.1 hypothetical protein AUR63_08200 [Guyparkeria sp. XI15]OAE88431.1 hypothetical protein AWR35_08215 [Guyparkeria sp. WRN-7]
MRKRVATIGALCLILVSAGCGGHVYQRPVEVPAARWNDISAGCWSEAYSRAQSQANPSERGPYEKAFRRAFDDCMQGHGFYRQWTWGMVK